MTFAPVDVLGMLDQQKAHHEADQPLRRTTMLQFNEEDLKAAVVQKAADEILSDSCDLSGMIAKEVKAQLDAKMAEVEAERKRQAEEVAAKARDESERVAAEERRKAEEAAVVAEAGFQRKCETVTVVHAAGLALNFLQAEGYEKTSVYRLLEAALSREAQP